MATRDLPRNRRSQVNPRSSSSRSYSDRTLKILWGRAAGRCALPNCRIELLADATDHDPIVVIGDIAHIEASGSGGPRGNVSSDLKSRDEYENLILLCKNCHARLGIIGGDVVKLFKETSLRIVSPPSLTIK